MRALRIAGFGFAALLLLAGALFLMLWFNELEAQYVNLGYAFGRDTREPRLTTRTLGLVLIGLGMLAGAATWIASRSYSSRRQEPGRTR